MWYISYDQAWPTITFSVTKSKNVLQSSGKSILSIWELLWATLLLINSGPFNLIQTMTTEIRITHRHYSDDNLIFTSQKLLFASPMVSLITHDLLFFALIIPWLRFQDLQTIYNFSHFNLMCGRMRLRAIALK